MTKEELEERIAYLERVNENLEGNLVSLLEEYESGLREAFQEGVQEGFEEGFQEGLAHEECN